MKMSEKILKLSDAAFATFSSSEWTEIGLMTDSDHWIDSHPRLLRSLIWRDDDYHGHVIDAVKFMITKDPDNLRILFKYPPISVWLQANEAEAYKIMSAEFSGAEVPEVIPVNISDVGFLALTEAQSLLRTSGPSSAIDRLHTGLQAYLKGVCDATSLPYPTDATANQLLKILIERHPSLSALGTREEEIRKVIKTSGAIVDSLGTIRNRASLAHPTDELLGQDEALLVINVVRSLLRYLDSKLV